MSCRLPFFCFSTDRRGSRRPELQATMSAYFPYTPEFNGLTGQQIQKIADSQAPIKPAGAGIAIQGVVYTTAILCTAVFSLRVWVRFIRREQGRPIGIDDYLAVGGFVWRSKDTVCGGRLLTEYSSILGPVSTCLCSCHRRHVLRRWSSR